MKNIFSFLSYHNAVPATLVVLALGAGSAFAASAGVLPLPVPVASIPITDVPAPESVDASALLAANLDTFDFGPTVTGVVETNALYTVSYSIETLAPEGSEWTASSKTGEFSVGKDSLGDGGLNAYVVGKLRDIENGERSYLVRAQAAEKALADAKQAQPAGAFAALVGLALDQIPVPVVEKPAAPESPQPQTPPIQPILTPAKIVAPAPEPAATSTPAVPESAPVATTTPVATSTPAQTGTSSPNTATSAPESIPSTNASTTPNTPPTLTINGENPAHVNVGDTYADLGATIKGPQADLSLGIKTFLNGTLTGNITVDTSQAATDTIDYVVADSAGLTSTSSRTVIVSAPVAPTTPSTSASSTVVTLPTTNSDATTTIGSTATTTPTSTDASSTSAN